MNVRRAREDAVAFVGNGVNIVFIDYVRDMSPSWAGLTIARRRNLCGYWRVA